eukprot:jgi/Astpho2/5485/e_gw1.00078.27.1_t
MQVACTCLGTNHPMLKGQEFDCCIVDEAGQMTLPASLGPLLKARWALLGSAGSPSLLLTERWTISSLECCWTGLDLLIMARCFVLVGDPNQLPPLVASREAEDGGLSTSLFKHLCDAHPQAVVALSMHAMQVLQPEQRVVFLDTDSLGVAGRELQQGDTISNPTEAGLAGQVVDAMVAAGLSEQQIGVLSPYRAQVALMQQQAKQRWPTLEVLTIDKYQGRDKDAILLSLVRSNSACNAGRLLLDWRRFNVAVTRAKAKLVILGSQTTLRSVPHFAQVRGLLT